MEKQLTRVTRPCAAVGDMAAASERVGEYRAKAQQFSKRIFDFLAIMFKFQVDQVLNPKAGADGGPARDKGRLRSHAAMEDFLGRYCGLMLFVKEIDQQRYQLICSVRRWRFHFPLRAGLDGASAPSLRDY